MWAHARSTRPSIRPASPRSSPGCHSPLSFPRKVVLPSTGCMPTGGSRSRSLSSLSLARSRFLLLSLPLIARHATLLLSPSFASLASPPWLALASSSRGSSRGSSHGSSRGSFRSSSRRSYRRCRRWEGPASLIGASRRRCRLPLHCWLLNASLRSRASLRPAPSPVQGIGAHARRAGGRTWGRGHRCRSSTRDRRRRSRLQPGRTAAPCARG